MGLPPTTMLAIGLVTMFWQRSTANMVSWMPETVIAQCERQAIDDDSGYMTSPHYPRHYPSDSNCTYQRLIMRDEAFELTFENGFDLQSCGGCTCDYFEVLVYSKQLGEYLSAKRWCGSDQPTPYVVPHAHLFMLKFISDSGVVGRGFNVTWKKIPPVGCSLTFEGNSGSIEYDTSFAGGCTWNISVPIGQFVQLDFNSSSDNNHDIDTLEVFDVMGNGSKVSRRVWRGTDWPGVLTSFSHQILVTVTRHDRSLLRSNSNEINFFNWYAVSECGGELSGYDGHIMSYNYPDDLQNGYNISARKNCTWDIVIPFPYHIELTFQNSSAVNSCQNLQIMDFSELEWEFKPHDDWCVPNNNSQTGTSVISHVVSSSNKIRVQYNQGNTGAHEFFASWTKGLIRGQGTGFIQTPNYPSEYPRLGIMSWIVAVEPGHSIFLEFEEPYGIITTERVFYTHYNYVQVTDIDPDSGSLLRSKKFYGTLLPHPYISSTSRIIVEFESWHRGRGPGFSAFWTKIDRECNHHMSGQGGYIQHPLTGTTSDSGDCRWTIDVRLGMFIRLEINSTSGPAVEGNASPCSGDRIEIFDVMGNSSRIRQHSLCGLDTPLVVRSFGSRMQIFFHRDIDHNTDFKGFTASWQAVEDCGGVFTASEGHVMSYNYPEIDHGHKLFQNACTWDILSRTPAIVLNIQQHSCDTLQILEFSESDNAFFPRHDWCTVNTTIQTVTSGSSRIRLVYAHGVNESSGLFVSWAAKDYITVCGQKKLTTMNGTFSSPKYGFEYPANLSCEWVMETVKDHFIHLDFQSLFDIEASNDNNCDYDYVEVLDLLPGGGLTSLGRFCGAKPPPPLISSSTKMVVRFSSDESKHGKGFSASWQSACGDVYKTLQGNVISPRFPSHYPESFDCRWEIHVLDGYIINLEFGIIFSLEETSDCDADYLEVYDYTPMGNPIKKGRWCGQSMPPLQTSMTSRMVLIFHSDGAKNYPGFYAKWESHESGCGSNFHSPNGTFTSPGFPQPYPGNQRCRWEIHVTPGQRVKLDFGSTFDLEMDKDGCKYDNVEVLDSLSNGTLVSFGKWCSIRKMPVFFTTSSMMVVSFQSDADKGGKGFSASWESVSGCGDVFTERAGHLLSPNYPSDYPENQDCRWEIAPSPDGPDNNNVTVHFDPQFELESGSDCAYDYVEVHRDNDVIGRWCGSDAPPDVTSNGQTLVVIFRSDKSVTRKGLFASWK